jgi:hypothetical protein
MMAFQGSETGIKIRALHRLSMHNATTHIYEVRPRRDKRGFDPISDALPFGCLWYTQVSHAIGYAEFTAGHMTL